MSYGYIGDTSTSIKQQVKNAGVLSMSDVLDLEGKGHLGGSLEHIETQIIDTTTSAIDFTNLKNYETHLLTLENWQGDAVQNSNAYIRVSNDGGSSFISTNTYYYSRQRHYISGSSGYSQEGRSTGTSYIAHIAASGNDAEESTGSMCYLHNLLDSSLLSVASYEVCSTHYNGSKMDTWYGHGAHTVAETHNAIRIYTTATNITGATAKLYGVKHI